MKTQLRKRTQLKFSQPSKTQQHFKQECDVNSILEKYRKTGYIGHIRSSQGQYGDFTHLGDFKSNLDMVVDAQNQFNDLPAHIRKRFANDPTQLIEFISDNSNREEAIKLGLIPEPVKPIPTNDDQTTIKPESTKPAPLQA